MWCLPDWHIASVTGRSDSPYSVNEYSTRGGTSANHLAAHDAVGFQLAQLTGQHAVTDPGRLAPQFGEAVRCPTNRSRR